MLLLSMGFAAATEIEYKVNTGEQEDSNASKIKTTIEGSNSGRSVVHTDPQD